MRRTARTVIALATAGGLAYGCSGRLADDAGDGGAATADAGADARRPGPPISADASPSPSPTSGPPQPSCTPAAGYTPQWKAPTPFGNVVCSSTQVEAMVSCALQVIPSAAQCNAVFADKANAPCIACLFTPDTARLLGPFYAPDNQPFTVNVAGCIANATGDSFPTSCAANVYHATECMRDACIDLAPAQCTTSCADQARQTVCKPYVDAAKCADALLAPGGAAAKCAAGATPLDRAIALGKLFCSAPTDGG